jgi:hypothetical protein
MEGAFAIKFFTYVSWGRASRFWSATPFPTSHGGSEINRPWRSCNKFGGLFL